MCRSSSSSKRFGEGQIKVSNSGRAEMFFPSKRSDLLGWPTLRPIPWVPPVDVPPGVKRPGCEADHSLLSSAEVKHEWLCKSTPVLCFHCVYMDSFTITLAFISKFCAESTLFECIYPIVELRNNRSSRVTRKICFGFEFARLIVGMNKPVK